MRYTSDDSTGLVYKAPILENDGLCWMMVSATYETTYGMGELERCNITSILFCRVYYIPAKTCTARFLFHEFLSMLTSGTLSRYSAGNGRYSVRLYLSTYQRVVFVTELMCASTRTTKAKRPHSLRDSSVLHVTNEMKHITLFVCLYETVFVYYTLGTLPPCRR